MRKGNLIFAGVALAVIATQAADSTAIRPPIP